MPVSPVPASAIHPRMLPGLTLDRRHLLRIGSLAISSATLPGLGNPARGEEATKSPTKAPADRVILLWMGGGVTHIDSFDPKPDAPEAVRGTIHAINTSLPGLHFAETMPHMAKLADQICLVRSFSHDSNDHLLSQVYTLSGRKVTMQQLFSEPNVGSIISYLHGPRNGLPGYIAVPGITRPGPPPHALFVGGWVGQSYAPFCVGGEPAQLDFTQGPNTANPAVEFEEDLKPRALRLPDEITANRLMDRSQLRQTLDRLVGKADRAGVFASADSRFDDALNLILSPDVRMAFDLNDEADAVREEYGRTKIGGRCLLARRLIEAGARFVMVDYGYDPDYGNLWDNHNAPSQNHPPIMQMVKRGYHLAGIDKAFAALIGDLTRRGLLDRTLVVFLTEFGRTPKINPTGGRDHWGACGSIFFTGGGAQVGQVIGQSDKKAAYPTGRGFTPADVAATIYQAVGIDTQRVLRDLEGRPQFVLPEGAAIPGVLGS